MGGADAHKHVASYSSRKDVLVVLGRAAATGRPSPIFGEAARPQVGRYRS